MDLSNIDVDALIKSVTTTNVTETSHRAPYPAVSPTRSEVKQTGRVVLITGGGTGVGLSTARAFVQASADTVIIIGRRADVLASAASRLEETAKTAGTNTRIISRTLDAGNQPEVKAFWDDLAEKDIIVDVFIANAIKFSEAKPLLELGTEEVWSQFDVNVRAPLYFAERMSSQPGDKQKFVINVSTQAAHMTAHPGVAIRPAYTLTKLTAALLFQLIALNTPVEKIQVVSFHPGIIYNEGWKGMGFPPELFDNDELCGNFAVWATSKEAEFLHGRFVWAAWDVEELAKGEVRKRIDEDPYFLRSSIVGLNGGLLVDGGEAVKGL